MIVAALGTTAISCAHVVATPTPTPQSPTTVRFTADAFTMTYPAAWHAVTFPHGSGLMVLYGYFGTEVGTDSCGHIPVAYDCPAWPAGTLGPDSAIIRVRGVRPYLQAPATYNLQTVGRLMVYYQVTASVSCNQVAADAEIHAQIANQARTATLLFVEGCVRDPEGRQERLVRELVASIAPVRG